MLTSGLEMDENGLPSPTEDREIEELLSYLDDNDNDTSGLDQHLSKTPYASEQQYLHQNQHQNQQQGYISDDEEYDQLFMEVIGANPELSQEGNDGQQCIDQIHDPGSSMDMS